MANARARLATCAAALLLANAPGISSAAIPTGSFEFQLGGANSLWMGGDQDSHEDADGFCASFGAGFDEVELCDYELTVDGRGKIGGHVEFVGWIDGTRVALAGPIKGAQRGDNRSGVTRASFVVRLAGTASQSGYELDTSLSLKLLAQIDAGGVMNGTWTQKICNQGAPCETSQWPAGPTTWHNGHWTLALDVYDLGGGALGGSAQIQFGDDSVCEFTLGGRYDAKQDAAKVALTPVSPRCAGGSLRLQHLARRPGQLGEAYLGLVQYKLFGVNGATFVHSETAALNRILLEYALSHPEVFAVPVGSAGSNSSGVTMMVTFVQLPPPIPPVPQTSVGSNASITMSAIDVLEESRVFPTLQPDAQLELQGFEARSVGPERAVLDATPVDPLDSSPSAP